MAYTTEYTVREELQQGLLMITLDNGKQIGFIVDGSGNPDIMDAELHAALFADFQFAENIERFAALCVDNPSTGAYTYYNTRPV
jgi:hypothetical protein